MSAYDNLPTTIGELKLAAIDKFMADQSWPKDVFDDRFYSLWGWVVASSYHRPGDDGSGGGEPWGVSEAGDSMAPSFDNIRGWIDDLTSKWLDLPDGTACTDPARIAGDTATKFGVAAGTGSVAVGYIGDRNASIDNEISNGEILGGFVAPFKDKYRARFGDVCMGLGAASAILQINYSAQAALWPAARDDVASIIVATKDAMRDAADASASAYIDVTLGVIGVIVAGAATVATAGAAAPLVGLLVTIGGAAATATAGMNAHATITGSTYSEMLESMGDALTQVDEGITAQEQGLATMLSEASSTIRDNLAHFNLDAYEMQAEREDADEMKMNRTNTDSISNSMRDIVEGLDSAKSGFGVPPQTNPTPRTGGVGLGSSGTHVSASNLHDLTARCLELTLAEYELGKALFEATVEDFFDTEAAADSDVDQLAADEAVTSNLGV